MRMVSVFSSNSPPESEQAHFPKSQTIILTCERVQTSLTHGVANNIFPHASVSPSVSHTGGSHNPYSNWLLCVLDPIIISLVPEATNLYQSSLWYFILFFLNTGLFSDLMLVKELTDTDWV